MTVSKLARATITTSKSSSRYMKVAKFTPHYMCAKWTGEQCARYFRDCDRSVSANYCIGYDGGIVCNVPEERRAWTSSSEWNDQRAITVECANLPGGALTDATWNSLVKLGADVCRRYGFRPYYDGTRNGTITEHMMFTSTDCPGPWLHPRMGDLAVAIRNELDGGQPKPKPTVVPKPGPDEEVPMAATQGKVHRVYNPYSHEHLYTTNEGEVKGLVSAGWQDEGTIGVAPEGYAVLYRLYNASSGQHLWTDSISEVRALLKQGDNYSDGSRNGWQYEGEACVVYRGDRGARKVHRLYNPFDGAHMLTPSEGEVKALVDAGWKDEGVKFSLDA